MPDLPSPEVKALIEAIDTFGEQRPRDLPDGVDEKVKALGQELRGYTGGEVLSPGEKEAKLKEVPGSDEAVPHPKAAIGPDGPSPGQREYEEAAQKAQEVAEALSSRSN